MKKTTLILAAALPCVCLLTGCGYSLEGGQPDGEVVSNDGIALRQGDYIYYINGSMPTLLSDALSGSDQAAVFRMKADGTQKQRLSTKKPMPYMCTANICICFRRFPPTGLPYMKYP